MSSVALVEDPRRVMATRKGLLPKGVFARDLSG